MSPPTPPRPRARRRWKLYAAVVLALLAVNWLFDRFTRRQHAPAETALLTGEAGSETFPALAPDGRQVAYSATGPRGGPEFHVFLRQPGGSARQLTQGPGSEVAPAFSPDGRQIAFARLVKDETHYLVVPTGGGAERKLASFVFTGLDAAPGVTWTPDGRALALVGNLDGEHAAIALAPAGGGTPRPLTAPPAGSHDGSPAVSPDGRLLAFVRRTGEQDDIYVTPLAGGDARRLTYDGRNTHGLAWLAQDVIFSSQRGEGFQLWRVPAGGGIPKGMLAGAKAEYPALAAGRLAYVKSVLDVNLWRYEIPAKGEAAEPIRLIFSAGEEREPRYSPDGKRLVYISDRSGERQIWVSDAEGRNAEQLTRLEKERRPSWPAWSPDGRTLIFEARNELYTIPSRGGEPRRLETGKPDAFQPAWSPDGKWIYFVHEDQIWRVPAAGGETVQVTKRHGSRPLPSREGKLIYYYRRGRGGIWTVPAEGGDEAPLVDTMHWSTELAAAGKSLYFFGFDHQMHRPVIEAFDLQTRSRRTLLKAEYFWGPRSAAGMAVSPDGRFLLIARADRSDTDLVLVENIQ